MSIALFDANKKKVGEKELLDWLFGAEVFPHLLNDAVRAQMAWRYEYRTANALTRTEVHGTRKKMYKQKGTGQARHGDAKAPIFVGGGKAHGPRPRRVSYKLNKKVMRKAMCSALSLQHRQDRLYVLSGLGLEKPVTKAVQKILGAFGLRKALFITCDETSGEKNFNLSVRNVPAVKCLRPAGVNVFDILKYENLIFSEGALEQFQARFAKES